MKALIYDVLPILSAGEKYKDVMVSTKDVLFLDDGHSVDIKLVCPAWQYPIVINGYFFSVTLSHSKKTFLPFLEWVLARSMPRGIQIKMPYITACYRKKKRMRISKRQILPTSSKQNR